MHIHRRIALFVLAFAAVAASAQSFGTSPTPPTSLKLGYLASNAAQASRDPASGEVRGVVPDIFSEIKKRVSGPVTLVAINSPAAVLEAVQKGEIDLGFVAPNPGRMGVVAYSQTYMLVQQSFLVRQNSSIQSVSELGRQGQVLGANAGDSIALYLKTNLPQATIAESPDMSMKEAAQWLADDKVVAFGGNRQRLGNVVRNNPSLRLLQDNLYGVPQAIAVANDKPELLAWVDKTIDVLRSSGALQSFITRSGVDGISVAPAAK